MDVAEKKPVVVFATRSMTAFGYFEPFFPKHAEQLKINFVTMYLEFDGEPPSPDAKGQPRDDALIGYVRRLKPHLTGLHLLIIGTESGGTFLYHNGIDGAPVGFVPAGTDYEAFADAIALLLHNPQSVFQGD